MNYAYHGVEINIAHFYSGTFSMTIDKLYAAYTIYTVPAHNRHTTVDEFHRCGYEYPYPHISDDHLWELFSRGYRLADLIITPSCVSQRFMQEEGCKNVIVIPHGTDIPADVKPMSNLDHFNVGYLGQLGPDKGVRYLIEAWSKLNYTDGKLMIGGSDVESARSFINHWGNTGQYLLMGRLNNISDLYNNIQVYIQPSICESFGIEILEAMMHERVVIASEGAGASEIINDGEDGFVVKIRDVDGIADRIDYCKNHPGEIIRIGKNARVKAQNYTWDKVKMKYAEVYNKCM